MQLLDSITLNKVASVLADLLSHQSYEPYPYNGTFPQFVTPKSGHTFARADIISGSIASNHPGGYRIILTDNMSTNAYTRYVDVNIAGIPDTPFSFTLASTASLPAGTYVLQVRKQSATALDYVHTIRISIGNGPAMKECDAPVEAKSEKPKKA